MNVARIAVVGAAILMLGPGAAQGRPDSFQSLKDQLAREGLAVNRYGECRTTQIDLIGMYCAGIVPGTQYQNKGAPYVVFQIPGPSSGGFPGVDDILVRLGSNEAIVIVGRTPPRAKFFGFYAYMHNRAQPPPRHRLWNDIGDGLNISTIRTTGPDPFDRDVVLIYSADQGTAETIRGAARTAGYPNAIINTVAIPSAMTKLGLDDTADEFIFLERMAVFEDEIAGNDYVRTPPLNVLRVTPVGPRDAKPFPTPLLRVRGTGRTEMDLMPDVERLREEIVARHAGSAVVAAEYVGNPVAYEGYDYTQRGADSIGDNRDAHYLAAGDMPEFLGSAAKPMTLAADEFFVAYGVNHVATGKATYTNVSVYATTQAQLALGVRYDHELAGSAAQYLEDSAAAGSLYALKIARNCSPGEAHCMTLRGPDPCAPFEFHEQTPLGFWFRTYLEPTTAVGPAYSEVIFDRIIKFSPRP